MDSRAERISSTVKGPYLALIFANPDIATVAPGSAPNPDSPS
jgi:hypothetical protein